VSEGGIYEAAGQALPKWSFVVLIGASALMLAISSLGLVGAYKRARGVLITFAFLSLTTGILQCVVTVFLALYANDKPTIAQVDRAIEQSQDYLEESLVNFAVDPASSEGWVSSQDLFGCCGVDVAALYTYPTYNLTRDEFLYVLLTGEAKNCSASVPVVAAFMDNNTEYSEQLEPLLLQEVGDQFFCKDKIREVTVQATVYLCTASGLLVLLQITGFGCAVRLVRLGNDSEDDNGDSNWKKSGGPSVAPIVSSSPSYVSPEDNSNSMRYSVDV
jgi:hypothetical protein